MNLILQICTEQIIFGQILRKKAVSHSVSSVISFLNRSKNVFNKILQRQNSWNIAPLTLTIIIIIIFLTLKKFRLLSGTEIIAPSRPEPKRLRRLVPNLPDQQVHVSVYFRYNFTYFHLGIFPVENLNNNIHCSRKYQFVQSK